MVEYSRKRRKMLISSISYFSYVFNSLIICLVKTKDCIAKGFNSSPNNNILECFKLKALNFADDNINVTETIKFVLGWIENTAGKGENAGYQHFLLFPQCFQKASFSRSLNLGLVWQRINF